MIGRRRIARRYPLVVFLGVAVALTGCTSIIPDDDEGAPAPQPVVRNATLQGSQEVPPVATSAAGTGVVTVSADRSTITVVLNTSGLTNPTAAHVHVGALGQNGPVIFTLFNATTDGALPATLTRTLTSANLEAQPAQGINTFADTVNAIVQGSTYLNAHTQANPGGEIRGQLVQ